MGGSKFLWRGLNEYKGGLQPFSALAFQRPCPMGPFTRATTVARLHFFEDIFEDVRLYQ